MSAPNVHDAPTVRHEDGAPPPPSHRQQRLQLRVHDESDAKGRSSTPAILLGLLLAMTAGLGYGGWLLYGEQQRSAVQRRASKAAQQAFQQERTRTGKQVADLQQSNVEQAARLVQSDADQLELKATLAATQSRLDELQAEREQLSAQMAEYRQVTQQFRSMIDSGKLAINFRRGRMIVELPAAVLFASGSAELSLSGGSALKEVAAILVQVPGKRFIVAGHTDNVPLSKSQSGYSSNWALSAARAVTVTEALLAAGLRPTHLVAAGYGEYDPIASNDNPPGRQKNRRIEIVLEPELKELPSALTRTDAPHALEPAAPSQVQPTPP